MNRNRRSRLILVLAAVVAVLFPALAAAEPDGPAAETAGKYGYLVQGGSPCAVWWAEGAYKVMRDDPVPAAEQGVVSISAARNEYEPFLIVLRPKERLDDVRVRASPLADAEGAPLPAEF